MSKHDRQGRDGCKVQQLASEVRVSLTYAHDDNKGDAEVQLQQYVIRQTFDRWTYCQNAVETRSTFLSTSTHVSSAGAQRSTQLAPPPCSPAGGQVCHGSSATARAAGLLVIAVLSFDSVWCHRIANNSILHSMQTTCRQ